MKKNVALKSAIEIAEVHAARLEIALAHIKNIMPLQVETLANLNDENLGFLELLTGRFAKLQDIIEVKIFPMYLEMLQEDISANSFLDNLHKLEKLNIIPSNDYWIKMREIRNHVTHEYPDNPPLMVKNLNDLIKYAQELLKFWKDFKNKICN